MSLVKYAKAELRNAGLFDADGDFDGEIAPVVVALMETFVAYGHSGGSAEQTLAIFDRLAHYKPLTALTGEDSEWTDRSVESGYPFWQNNRCHSVFRDGERAWISAGGDSFEYITFPYMVQ